MTTVSSRYTRLVESYAQQRLALQTRLEAMAQRGQPKHRGEPVADQLFADEPNGPAEPNATDQLFEANQKYTDVEMLAGDYNQANLEDVIFDGCILANTRLAGANLRNASIARSTLRTVDAAGAIFDGANITETAVTESRFTGADFGRSTISRVTFTETNLTLARFYFAKLSNVTFRDCDLTSADFQGSKATNIVFERCRINRTEFSHSTVKSGAIRNCEIELVRGLTFLAGMTLDKSALISLAPAFALSLGFKVEEVV